MFSFTLPTAFPSKPHLSPVRCGVRELRERIQTVEITQKVTETMKLVAAARVRRAQEAVVNGRPFSSNLAAMLNDITQRLHNDDVSTPLTHARPVKNVALVVFTADRGLCGSFNKLLIRKAITRIEELKKLGLGCVVISVGKKGNSFFSHHNDDDDDDEDPFVKVDSLIEIGGFPTTKEAQVIADDVFSLFVSEEVDKVELVYTKFVSLVRFEPVVHTLLPLGVDGNCGVMGDEVFRLSSKGGKLAVERESVLRGLQESLASELAARMGAMAAATDNAVELRKSLSVAYNRERQAKITGELLEIDQSRTLAPQLSTFVAMH
ncbi:ATP synthase gamma chain 1, chloroplastic, partial [Mucuna pruriens]